MRILPVFVVAALSLASAAHATLIADFELNGSLDNSAGTAVTLANNAGTGSLGSTGITFGINQGPTITGLAPTTSYTIDMTFTLDALNGPRGNGYIKLVDFSNLASDSGFYSHNAHFSIYPFGDSTDPVFTAGVPVRLTLSHASDGTVAGYIDGVQLFGISDPTNRSETAITAALNFFIDDTATASGEASSGFVDYIRIYDTPITPGEATPAAVPEPASWALMVGGFGLVGGAMRRRTHAARVTA
ncbi:PEPxxWA-CTERM sorting domain-containing protein [Sphingomonas nostoxanthinifaciens]|uniref:PEPxxWA-CTERM sorting domain-containing protein n=1 Tax=Sphingomonas nostoxanthinifaciens TaxID=2872652 RepID=UPI001CC1CC2B|nr:PEPxxWA-CTERM sorting domain-containing protein [Sphingomonas nostoxanthinifaciens]